MVSGDVSWQSRSGVLLSAAHRVGTRAARQQPAPKGLPVPRIRIGADDHGDIPKVFPRQRVLRRSAADRGPFALQQRQARALCFFGEREARVSRVVLGLGAGTVRHELLD